MVEGNPKELKVTGEKETNFSPMLIIHSEYV